MRKLNRNAFNEKLIHRYLIERYYFGDSKTRAALLLEEYRKSKINLIVPEEVRHGAGYRADLTLYFKNHDEGVPVEVKWNVTQANQQNQLTYLAKNGGFVVALSDGRRPENIPTIIINQDDFKKWTAENISKLTSDSIAAHANRNEISDPQHWLVFLRGDALKNFKKMLDSQPETPFWAFKQHGLALRHILDIRRGDKCIFMLAVTQYQKMSSKSKEPVKYYSWYATTVLEPNYMELDSAKGIFFEKENAPIGKREWPHFIDFKIEDSYESKQRVMFGDRGEWSDAMVNSVNHGGGAPQPLTKRQYEQLIDTLHYQMRLP